MSSSSAEIRLTDAQDYLERMIAASRAQSQPDAQVLSKVLEHIAQYMRFTRREIASLRAGDGKQDMFATASDELEEVVAEAARATNEILSAAEAIEKLAPGGTDSAATLQAATTRIFEACAFQDITGQRISKVIRIVKDIEARVVALATACGGEVENRLAETHVEDPREDARLLNGPGRDGEARSQDEIDKLFEDAS